MVKESANDSSASATPFAAAATTAATTAPASSSISTSCARLSNFAKALPDTRVFYAVKANPAPEVLSLLAGWLLLRHRPAAEIEMCSPPAPRADRISFGNTIKKKRDIARAY